MRIFISTFLLGILLIYSCKKDENIVPNPPISNTPLITFKTINKTTVKEFTDTVLVAISYLDGDGDIGFNEADSASIFVTDTRKNLTEEFHIAPLAPTGTKIAITGTLVIRIGKMIRFSSASSETTTLKIKLKDRAGNWSNEVESPSVVITN